MSSHAHTNRLIHSTSPYLLQHAHNPVDWYPWGTEAFEASRAQNKPIFLSVGYSTCYWCHVMERQCFENEAVAKVMNELFINIKVDREERPDVDQLYMLAVQVLTHHGGWPMSVFLTPDRRPFYGGTYFPPDRFVPILRAISDAFHNRKDDIEQSATQLKSILQQIARPSAADAAITIDEQFLEQLIERSVDDYEPRHGGFGSAPKFPRETLLEMLLVYCRSASAQKQKDVLPKVLHALDVMAAGGIHDHLGGGFHRYSTDEKWLVPHFEIMLYDNAMLAWCYVEAYRQTEEVKYATTARGILDYVLREMTSPRGAFYTAYDAEVDGQEGLNYLWTPEEVEQVLSDAAFNSSDVARFKKLYGLDAPPNFADPHHGTGRPDKYVLHLKPGTQTDEQVARMCAALREARSKRKQPLLDTKIITSWNALAIRAFAYAGQILNEPRYVAAASSAAEFLLTHHREPNGGLVRTTRPDATGTSTRIAAFLDDYAFLVQALLALRDASGLESWKDQARTIADAMSERFGDAAGGFYFTESAAQDLIVRQMTASDSPLPSGNAVAAMAMLALDEPDRAKQTVATFARQLRDQAEGMSSMVQAALMYVRQHGPIDVQAREAAQRPMSPEQIAASIVSMRPTLVSATELHLHVNIMSGFHINAHETAAGLIPTRLAIAGAEVASIDYPPGDEQRFAFAQQPMRVYSDTLTIAATLSSPIAAGTELRLRLTYQACDDNACLPPVTKQVDVQVQ